MVIISGFSTGAFVVSNLIATHSELFNAAAILSGGPPTIRIAPFKISNKKLFIYHGEKDSIIPFEKAKKNEIYFKNAGW